MHDTVLGRAESHWSADGGEMLFHVVVPDGATATVVPPLHPDRLSIEVSPSAHSWRYPLPGGFGAEEVLSLETPIKDVMKHDALWQAVLEVKRTYFPGVPVEAAGSHIGDLPLGMLAARLPQNGEAMERDLIAAPEAAR